MAVSPTVWQAISRANNTNIGTPPAPTSPIGVEPMTGGNQSITPGQIVFTEYQHVFLIKQKLCTKQLVT